MTYHLRLHEILHNLAAGSIVLDLGCAGGSFDASSTAALVVRADSDSPPRSRGGLFVRCDAGLLPFKEFSFDAIVSNHSLEHFVDLSSALSEIRRVVKPEGALFVSVPDASTLTDRVYRWLYKGGGHVNPFTCDRKLAIEIEAATGLKHVATRLLISSLSFLNRNNCPQPQPRRMLLLGGGHEWTLCAYAWISRRLDRMFPLRTSVYGWAFYFGRVGETVDRSVRVNVCIRCGSGHPSSDLETKLALGCFRTFRCSCCGAVNPFLEDAGKQQPAPQPG